MSFLNWFHSGCTFTYARWRVISGAPARGSYVTDTLDRPLRMCVYANVYVCAQM